MNVLLAGVNLGGNVGDAYICQMTIERLLDRGAERIVLLPMQSRLLPTLGLALVEPYRPHVSLEEPLFLDDRSLLGRLAPQESRLAVRTRVPFPEEWRSYRWAACGGNHGRRFFRDVHCLQAHVDRPGEPFLFGPIGYVSGESRGLVSRVLRSLSGFAVREPATAQYLASMGVRAGQIVPDIAFSGFQETDIRSTGSGAAGLCIRGRTTSPRFVETFCQAARKVGLNPVIVSTHAPQDLAAILELQRMLPGVRFEAPATPDAFLDLARGLEWIVSARLHGLIMSGNARCLAIPLCDTPKLRDYASFMEAEVLMQGTEPTDELAAKLDRISRERASLRAKQDEWFAKAKRNVLEYVATLT